MRYLLLLICLSTSVAFAQTAVEKKTMDRLKATVSLLADDKLEGRRTGTPGEVLAYDYISKAFKSAGLQAMGDNGSYLQVFDAGKDGRQGHNVVGYLNNKAPFTIVLGAHFDHLGYGEDRNSLYHDSMPMIHNGADDNASGTAALIELARWLKTSGLRNYNYLFVAFSGEELGLFGSKYFTEHMPVAVSNINYMINMDMVGRLNDSSKAIAVGGFGTSPSWGTLVKSTPALIIKTDSSGTGPSDHTSFYRKDIPVLFFFTGSHSDYHKPSDDADKINYAGIVSIIDYIKYLLAATDKTGKLVFAKTREVAPARAGFKVSLGLMPDYTFAGPGIYVDGISSGRAAEKAGILKGDIILQVGEIATQDMQGYVKALNSFDKGQQTTVSIKRGDKEIILPILF